MLQKLIERMLDKAGIKRLALPEHVRLRRRGHLTFAFNYGTEPWLAPADKTARFRLGACEVASRDLACWGAHGSKAE